LITEIRKNGAVVSTGRCAASYIQNSSGQIESSNSCTFFLSGLVASDEIDATVIQSGGVGTITVQDEASMVMEYIAPSRTIFYANATQTTNSTNFNDTTDYPVAWTHSVQDTGFTHTNNTGNITIAAIGTYLIHVSIPISGAGGTKVEGYVRLDGVTVTGGTFRQGALIGQSESSLSWSGVVQTTSANQVLTIEAGDLELAGIATIAAGYEASVYIEKLSSTTGIYFANGTQLANGGTFNSVAASAIKWTTDDIIDTDYYTHSTAVNPQSITIAEDGDYLLMLNSSLVLIPASNYTNARFRVAIDGVNISGAIASGHYGATIVTQRNSGASLVYLLKNLTAGNVITVTSQREGAAGTVNGTVILTLLKKP